MRSDEEVKRDVEAELHASPAIEASDITVAVKNGVVTLSGYVRSYSQKWEAERDAKRVVGVVGIANDIEVRLPLLNQRPDPEIARDAVAAISAELPYSAEHVRVVVRDGWVTIEGSVEWHYQRERAETAVRRLRGVKSLTNLISLQPSLPPVEIKRKIEDAFCRSAEVDAARITVATAGGTVTLNGTVRSWAERQEAERTAWATPGVVKVENHIVVSPL